MDKHQLIQIASQLRKPSGGDGLVIGEFMNKGNVQMHADTFRIMQASGEDHILEIGMGNGFFVKDIVGPNPLVKYTGCDYSEVMVNEAVRINGVYIEEGRVQFLHAAAGSLPLEINTFDKIFTVNTIYFWEQQAIILQDLRKLLKPEGILIIAFRPERQMKNYPFTPYGFELFSSEKLQKLLRNQGFVVISVYENHEPDFDLKGEIMKMENTVVVCKKASRAIKEKAC